MVPKSYKFGVLYCKSGQKTEDEMFNNGKTIQKIITYLIIIYSGRLSKF